MGKKKDKREKKAGKRMNKKQLAALLMDYFHEKGNESVSLKKIFEQLRTTSPRRNTTSTACTNAAWR